MHSNWKATLIHTIGFLVPFFAALALVILNIRATFFGDTPSTAVTDIQFAAKFHELLMQASLTVVSLSIIRARLFGSKSLPLGAVVAPYRTTDVSYLWSLEFGGFMASLNSRKWKDIGPLLILPLNV